MSWSPAMRAGRLAKGGQVDMFDGPALAYKLVCDGNDPLTNAFVKARKSHPCNLCPATIQPGERVRRETRRSTDGRTIETRHVCAACCERTGAEVREHVASVASAKGRKPDQASGTVARPAGAPAGSPIRATGRPADEAGASGAAREAIP